MIKGEQIMLHTCLPHASLFTVLLLICGYNAVSVANETKNVTRISVDKVNAMLTKPETVIIDVRKYRNWWRSSKKISTAVREDPQNVDQWIGKYSKEKTLIFYCA